jgi:hypothetical protein
METSRLTFFFSRRSDVRFGGTLKTYGFAEAAGAAAADLPEAPPKNLKKSESGRNRKRVALLFRPVS